MSATLQQPPAAPVQPLPPAPRGSLVKAELHRFRARRFIQALIGLAVLGWIAALVISLTQFGVPDEGDYAQAQQRIEQEVEAEVDDAVRFAEESDFPDPSTLFDHLYEKPERH